MPTITYCLLGVCLSPEAWAAWAQAIGSVVAIFVAIGVAAWQSHASSELLAAQRRRARIDIAQTLAALAEDCARLVEALNQSFRDRERIYFLADGGHPDWPELLSIERRLDGWPIHELPAYLVPPRDGTVRSGTPVPRQGRDGATRAPADGRF